MSNKRFIRCYACCNAELYNMSAIYNYLKKGELNFVRIEEVLFLEKNYQYNDVQVFLFHFGCTVIWNANESQEKDILSMVEKFIEKKLPNNDNYLDESEVVQCIYDPCSDQNQIKEDTDQIILNSDNRFTKLAVSYAISQSVKLNFLENSVNSLLRNTQPIHEELSVKGKTSLSKKQISKKMGNLFHEKYLINMHSDMIDIPEVFWNNPNYEPLYIMTAKFHDIHSRQSILNKRLRIVEDLYNLLSSELNAKRSNRMELIIIVLITIEVLFAVTHIGK